MSEYTIIFEDAGSNYVAYVPDLPGCVGAADTVEELRELMREAIELHIEGLRREGVEVPPPSTKAGTVIVTP
jgi:predicted RNase H-like HicB family nuclease